MRDPYSVERAGWFSRLLFLQDRFQDGANFTRSGPACSYSGKLTAEK